MDEGVPELSGGGRTLLLSCAARVAFTGPRVQDDKIGEDELARDVDARDEL